MDFSIDYTQLTHSLIISQPMPKISLNIQISVRVIRIIHARGCLVFGDALFLTSQPGGCRLTCLVVNGQFNSARPARNHQLHIVLIGLCLQRLHSRRERIGAVGAECGGGRARARAASRRGRWGGALLLNLTVGLVAVRDRIGVIARDAIQWAVTRRACCVRVLSQDWVITDFFLKVNDYDSKMIKSEMKWLWLDCEWQPILK